jgi:alpha-mannosidase
MEQVRIKDKMRSAYSPQMWLGVLIERIRERQYELSHQINDWEIREAVYLGPGHYEWIDEDWKPFRSGTKWGGENHTAFFRCDLIIPDEFDGKYGMFRLKPGGEGLLRLQGIPFAGLDTKHDTVFLAERLVAGERFHLEIEQTVDEMEIPEVLHVFELSELVALNRETEDSYHDFKCLYDLMSTPQADPEVAAFLFHEIKKALSLIQFAPEGEDFPSSLRDARQYLADNVYNSGRYKQEGRLNMVGHSHLDFVYQWDYNEYLRKIGRTHSTTLNIMREFPDYLFCQSQLRIYDDLQEYYPEIYDGMKKRIKENRWEVIGGMYVEPDCNLISGESFTRQLLVGNEIAKRAFGTTSSVCWLPDVFGIAWYIPQVLKQTGYKYLITNKPVIWNDTNEFPHNTFWWEGPDGSRILAHLPCTHFGASIDPDILLTNWNEYKQKIVCSEAIYNYGYADGRGGPNREDILTGRRFKNTPGVPASEFVHGQEAFDRMEAKAQKLPVMKDELYLETHRGTYTTQARLKRNNRKAEILYRNAEALASMATVFGKDYPGKELEEGWKLILKNQFHDILPGSHVNSAYHEAVRDYKMVFQKGDSVFRGTLKFLAGKMKADNTKLASFAVFNMQPWIRNDVAELEVTLPENKAFRMVDQDGEMVPHQIMARKGDTCRLLTEVRNIPPMGHAVYHIMEGNGNHSSGFVVNEKTIENTFFRIRFHEDGTITELFDKTNLRQVFARGAHANKFQLFEDEPGKYAAWDIVQMYKDHEFDVAGVQHSEITEKGPVRLVVEQERQFYKSSIRQKIILYHSLPRIDFETEIDWQERDRLLKVGFPANVNAMKAAYDISYGYIERPTHQNTSWDAARFEVCGHMWADLSEGDYGLSLLNDCKYGHDILGNQMRLTLLKGPQYPDKKADLGKHYFTYSLFPHAGDWRQAQTPRRAWELNDRIMAIPIQNGSGDSCPSDSFLQIDRDHVMLSALKMAEDGNGIIIRLYEDQNRRGRCRVSFFKEPVSAVECNPLEKKTGEAEIVSGALEFDIKPFEIKTFRIFFNLKQKNTHP